MARKKTKPERRGGAGRGQGRKTRDGARDLKRINVMLDRSTIDKATALGAGNLSLGIRKALA